jgi:hypothetical protein
VLTVHNGFIEIGIHNPPPRVWVVGLGLVTGLIKQLRPKCRWGSFRLRS